MRFKKFDDYVSNRCCVCAEIKSENFFFKRNEKSIRASRNIRNFCFDCIKKYNEYVESIIKNNKTTTHKIFDFDIKYEILEESKRLTSIYAALEYIKIPKEIKVKNCKEQCLKKDKEKLRAYNRKYHHENLEKVHAKEKRCRVKEKSRQKRREREKSPEYVEKRRKYQQTEKYKNTVAKWKKTADGKASIKLGQSKRRTLIEKAKIVKFSNKDYLLRMEVFGNKCYYCDGPFEHLDHAIALSKGGYHCLANFRPSCESCNLSKSSKSYKEWIDSLPKFNKEEIKKVDNNNEGSDKDNN
jgi:5-methylcytosine-specific restriction endonuclease McrA